MLNIQSIKLLKGSHGNMGATGQGCFMNVIAYLNGEAVITDKSECVCPTIRRIAIWINDLLLDDERQILLPFVLRVMGTRIDDKNVVNERLRHVVSFAKTVAACAASAKYAADATADVDYAAGAANAAAACANYAAYAADATADAKYAAYAAGHAAAAAVDAAIYAAACTANTCEQVIDATIAFLDAVCPPLESCTPSPEVINRANELIELNAKVKV